MTNRFLPYLFLALLATLNSCDNRSCDEVVCGINSSCFQGRCYCADGLEGNDCSTFSAQKYQGNYQVQEICDNGGANFGTYSATILPGQTPSRLFLTGLFAMGVTAEAIIRTDGNNRGNILEINTQSVGALVFSGEGTYDEFNNRLTINFNYTFGGVPYNCRHTFFKQ